jgi:hypothetical protein
LILSLGLTSVDMLSSFCPLTAAASKAGISPDRIIVTSVDPATGMVSVDILSSAFGSNANSTLYTGNFTVGMTSISTSNATNILLAAGIVPVDVRVFGNMVTYTSANVTADMLARLRSDPRVTGASNTGAQMPDCCWHRTCVKLTHMCTHTHFYTSIHMQDYIRVHIDRQTDHAYMYSQSAQRSCLSRGATGIDASRGSFCDS